METPVSTGEAVREYVRRVEEWQASLELNDAQLCRLIGADKGDWSRYSRFDETNRPPTDLFHTRVMTKAEGHWRSYLREAWQGVKDALQRDLEARVLARSA